MSVGCRLPSKPLRVCWKVSNTRVFRLSGRGHEAVGVRGPDDPRTILAGGFGPKINLRLAAVEQELKGPSTSYLEMKETLLTEKLSILKLNSCLKGSLRFCSLYCMCLSLLSS